MTVFPVLDSPTNDILRIEGFVHISVPTVLPGPVKMFSTPGGKPASFAISPNITALNGVYEAGLTTTVFPAAKAADAFQVNCINGKFQGIINVVTPAGAYCTYDICLLIS